MLTEERRSQLADRCEKHITWLMTLTPEAMTVCNSVKEQLDIYGIALAALTQPASPALKLPDAQEQVIGVWNPSANEIAVRKLSGIKVVDFAHWHCHCTKEVVIRDISDHPAILNAPHTAPIEPICGVKVPEGWSLVPNEATREMIEEGDQWELSENIWNAMIGVAAKP